jgi:hypothetical protein
LIIVLYHSEQTDIKILNGVFISEGVESSDEVGEVQSFEGIELLY